MSKRKARSRTPEVRWDSIPSASAKLQSDKRQKPPRVTAEPPAPAAPVDRGAMKEALAPADAVAARLSIQAQEQKAWRALVVLLNALKGDLEVEQLLREKHGELVDIAESCVNSGQKCQTLEEAQLLRKGWFDRQLKGGNRHGPAARAELCIKLSEELKKRCSALCSLGTDEIAEVLEEGDPETEGPLVCALLRKELEGSHYEGLWISREKKNTYILGDEHTGAGLPTVDTKGERVQHRLRAFVKVNDGQMKHKKFVKSKILIGGYYRSGEKDLTATKVAVGPLLHVWYEGVSFKEAIAQWNEVVPPAGEEPPPEPEPVAVAAPSRSKSRSRSPRKSNGKHTTAEKPDSLKEIEAKLPPGWELRESRSKKGAYYFANPAKGISQFKRPTK